MKIKILPSEGAAPAGRVAEAEIHFEAGEPLAGLKLIGFSVWERRGGGGLSVTFPARQYSVNGERRSFALLRPIMEPGAQAGIRDAIIAAYEWTISPAAAVVPVVDQAAERSAERLDTLINQGRLL